MSATNEDLRLGWANLAHWLVDRGTGAGLVR